MALISSENYGPWALVTGGARGLGAEFANQLAAAGLKVILVDRLEAELAEQAESIRSEFRVEVLPVCIDLAREDCLGVLLKSIGDREVGLLVNNAGIAKIGHFLPQDSSFLTAQLHVNTRAVLLLTHHFANTMVPRQRGGIVIVSSMAAEVASAYNANYCATKAYDLKLAEALWDELKPKGVDVLGFMPGPTESPGFTAEGGDTSDPMVMTVQDTVADALRQLGRRPSAAAGRKNRLLNAIMTRLLPRAAAIKLVGDNIKKSFNVPS